MLTTLLCLTIAISDGDTLKAKCPHTTEPVKVRLAQIDAPEKRQPFGQRSKQSLSELCYQKRTIIQPVALDRYGRTVAQVTCEGVDANREQVNRGMAWVYDQYATDRTLYTAQNNAKAAQQGLWSDAAPVPPWIWRKETRINFSRGQ
jgi:endonuclease YncB( thermonuclease family)